MGHLAPSLMPRSVPRIISWHSDIVRQRTMLRLYQPFLRRLIASADAIIAATPAHFSSSAQLPREAERATYHVVPYGFHLARFRARPPRAEEVRGRRGAGTLMCAPSWL